MFVSSLSWQIIAFYQEKERAFLRLADGRQGQEALRSGLVVVQEERRVLHFVLVRA